MHPEPPKKPNRIPRGYLASPGAGDASAEYAACSAAPGSRPNPDGSSVQMDPVSACDAHTLALMFSSVFKPIRQMPAGIPQDQALLAAAGLEAEARNGTHAEAGMIRAHAVTLGQYCPAALQAAAALFSADFPGVSPVFHEILAGVAETGGGSRPDNL